MKQKYGFFQEGHSATFLCSAVLAMAFIVQASPAHAEPVTLSCRSDKDTATFTFRINYTSGVVEQLAPSGDAYTNRIATATISPNAIIWSITQPSSYLTGDGVTHQTTELWEGHIDRLAATGWTQHRQGDFPTNVESFTCRQATQKF
ncbi:MAG: hypothetical protein PSX71_08515 [bacterium]|nr:hypothetical protein [bacterium]